MLQNTQNVQNTIKQWWMTHTTLKLEFTADSGGYTMKWRRVKPKPCEVRRRRSVLGPGQQNGSSSSWKSTPEESSWSTTSYGQTDEIMRKNKGQPSTTDRQIRISLLHLYTQQLWRDLNKIQEGVVMRSSIKIKLIWGPKEILYDTRMTKIRKIQWCTATNFSFSWKTTATMFCRNSLCRSYLFVETCFNPFILSTLTRRKLW